MVLEMINKRNIKKILWTSIGTIIFSFFIVSCDGPPPERPIHIEDEIHFSATNLVSSFGENKKESKELYIDKWLRVKGTIYKVKKKEIQLVGIQYKKWHKDDDYVICKFKDKIPEVILNSLQKGCSYRIKWILYW